MPKPVAPPDNPSLEIAEGEKKTKQRRRYSLPYILMGSLSLVVFIVSLVFLIPQLLEYKKASDESNKIKQGSVSDISDETGYRVINYQNLIDTNKEFTCWIDIPGTNICYPVVYPTGYHADNEYYLHVNFNLNSSVEGTPFVDYRSPKGFVGQYNVVIYGHRLTSGTMFTQLDRYQKQDFWKDHQKIYLYTPEAILIYTVFSAYMAPVDDDCYTFDFASSAQFTIWARNIAAKSNYNTGIVPGSEDSTILLSTCVANNIADRNNYRYITCAVLSDIVSNPAS